MSWIEGCCHRLTLDDPTFYFGHSPPPLRPPTNHPFPWITPNSLFSTNKDGYRRWYHTRVIDPLLYATLQVTPVLVASRWRNRMKEPPSTRTASPHRKIWRYNFRMILKIRENKEKKRKYYSHQLLSIRG